MRQTILLILSSWLLALGSAYAQSCPHCHSNKFLLDKIKNTGAGAKFLSDDGTYRAINDTLVISATTVRFYNTTTTDTTLTYTITTLSGKTIVFIQLENNVLTGSQYSFSGTTLTLIPDPANPSDASYITAGQYLNIAYR